MAEPGFLAVYGHEEIRQRLGRAAAAGRLPQSLLLYGPRGIGKQRLALWTATALNCSGKTPRPCGECRSCRLASRLEHPDIHWFFPLPRPKGASGPAKLQKKLEEARGAALADRRKNPYQLDDHEGASGIYLAEVHAMRQLAHKTPAMGPAKVLVIGRAETLVPQAASPEAANALLKLLEEPPADTTIILTTDVPGALLATIRSRLQAIRVAPISDDEVRRCLESELGMTADDARRLAARSGGSIGRALELGGGGHDRLREDALDLVRAALEGQQVAHLAIAHRFPAFGARGSFGRVLGETAGLLRDLLADSLGALPADPEAVASLSRGRRPSPARVISALEAVEEARTLADRNVNPQLIVVHLLSRAGASNGGSSARRGGRAGSR